MKKKLQLLVGTLLLFSFYAIAQFPGGKQVKPHFGQTGIKKKVSELRASAAAQSFFTRLDSPAIKPLKSYFKKYQDSKAQKHVNRTGAKLQLKNKYKPNAIAAPGTTGASTPGSTQDSWSNFLAIDFYENPIGWPPDPNGAVSKDQVIVASNNGIKVFAKRNVTDPPLLTPTGYSGILANAQLFLPLEIFFSPVLPATSSITDPHIRYDRLSKRWFIIAIEVNPTQENNLILLAVSDAETITDASSFIYYSFNSSLFPYDPNAPYAPFLDFPRLGVDKNSLLIGGNQFGWDSLTNVGYVIDKKRLIRGDLVVYPFELGVANFIDGSVSGMYTPQGVYNDDPSGKKSFFAGITYFQDGLVLAGIEYDDKNQPWLTSNISLPVEPFNNPRDNSSPGGLTPIDQLDTRLLAAAIHTNKLNRKSSLWTAHAIGVSQSGNYISGSDSDFVRQARTGSRWYEIGDIYSKPGVKQAGTLYDAENESGRRAVQYFNPSIAASGQGHAIVGGTTDAFDQYLNVFVAGRYNKDPEGTLKSPVKATNTTAIYAPYIDFGGGFHFYIGRWGDFSQTVVDPTDDQTIWTFQECANVDDSYGIRVVQVKAPPPATPLPIGPFSNKSEESIILKGISVNQSGFFDPGKDGGGPGYNRLSVKSSGNIQVSNLKFISPTEIRFKLNLKNKPRGNYSLVITNPDGQFVIADYQIKGSENKLIGPTSVGPQKTIVAKPALNSMSVTRVVPNPAKENTTIEISATKVHKAKIILIDLTGKQVSEKNYNFLKGKNYASISLEKLSKGIYIAAIYNAENVLLATEKIVKQ